MHSEVQILTAQVDNPTEKYPQCKGQNVSSMICQNPTCSQPIFLCKNAQCSCQQKHEFCLTVHLKPLLKIIKRKRQRKVDDVTGYIQTKIDSMIEELSKLRDQLFCRLDYLGLSQKQCEFINHYEKKQYNLIKSQAVHQICQNVHIRQTLSLENSLQYIKFWWMIQEKKFNQMLGNLTKSVMKSFKQVQFLKNFQSKIVQEDKFKSLIEMFPQKISSIKLLYRASEYSFSVPEFRNKSDKKPNNLCIVKTESGNIIGAYTPIAWDTAHNSKYIDDPSGKTFIFSLTMNKKFIQRNNGVQATHHYTTWGPRFGTDGSCDFAIGQYGNGVNGTSNCYANIGNLFFPADSEDDKNLQTIKQNFVGNGIRGTNKFRITQWQMFQVTF